MISCHIQGDCILATGATAPSCDCDHGYLHPDCKFCSPTFAGANCERCKDGYIGYNTTCDTPCINGYSQTPGTVLAHVELFTYCPLYMYKDV